MKQLFLVATFQMLVCAAFSQSTFSILSYTAPEGWNARQDGENLVLVKKGVETTNCKIVFFKPVKGIVNTVAMYTQYRNDLVGTTSKTKSWTSAQKESEPEWCSFSSLQHINANGVSDIAFYSISNSTETVFIAVYLDDKRLCADELDSIVSSINLTELNNNQQADKAKKAKPASRKIRVLPLKSLKALVV